MRVCVMRDCEDAVLARGFCGSHYSKWSRYGDPEGSGGLLALAHRFWSKVQKTDTCWIWKSTTGTDGRGNIRRPMMNVGGRAGNTKVATHVAWYLEHGKWPSKQMNHTCDNAMCVRHDHLYDGTPKQNMEDFAERGRGGKCLRGHDRTPENTQVRADGTRYCRKCQNEKRRSRPKKKETRTCTLTRCENQLFARGLCSGHYKQERKKEAHGG